MEDHVKLEKTENLFATVSQGTGAMIAMKASTIISSNKWPSYLLLKDLEIGGNEFII